MGIVKLINASVFQSGELFLLKTSSGTGSLKLSNAGLDLCSAINISLRLEPGIALKDLEETALPAEGLLHHECTRAISFFVDGHILRDVC